MTADNPSIVAKREKAAATAAKHRKNFLISAMRTVEGREFLYDLLARCHVFQTSFASDPHLTAFRCGEHNVGLMLTAELIAASETGYLEVLKHGRRNDGPETGGSADDGDADSDS